MKAVALTKETFGATSGVGEFRVSEEIRAEANVSGDVKEPVCNGERNVILPNTQSINGQSNEEPEVLFDFLVDLFSLTISLWVVGCGCSNFDAKGCIELMHKSRDELSATITDDLFWETMKLPDMVKKEPGNL